jgi:hypothetical protein
MDGIDSGQIVSKTHLVTPATTYNSTALKSRVYRFFLVQDTKTGKMYQNNTPQNI